VRETYSATPELRRIYDQDEKFKEWTRRYAEGRYEALTQKYLVIRALVESKKHQSLDELFEKLNAPPYWARVKHKGPDGEPHPNSFLMRDFGGIRPSIGYHLNRLKTQRLVDTKE
jgi:hypothetical protein